MCLVRSWAKYAEDFGSPNPPHMHARRERRDAHQRKGREGPLLGAVKYGQAVFSQHLAKQLRALHARAVVLAGQSGGQVLNQARRRVDQAHGAQQLPVQRADPVLRTRCRSAPCEAM